MTSVQITIAKTNEQFTLALIPRDDLRAGYQQINPDIVPSTIDLDTWDLMVELIEYSINEGGDTQRTLTDGEAYPDFSFQVINAN